MCAYSAKSESLQLHGLQPTRFLCPWDFSGKNSGVACHFLPLRDLPDPEIKLMALASPSFQVHSLPLCHHLKDSHNRKQVWTHQKTLVETKQTNKQKTTKLKHLCKTFVIHSFAQLCVTHYILLFRIQNQNARFQIPCLPFSSYLNLGKLNSLQGVDSKL